MIFLLLIWLGACSKEQQRSAKSMSVWEQRTNQLRKHNMKTSTEALFNELDPEERLRMSSTLHLPPDMKTHADRPLFVEDKNGDQTRGGVQEEAGGPRQGGLRDSFHTHSRRHYHHRDRNGEGGDSQGGRHHSHHSRSRELNADAFQEKERGGNPEGGQRHHHQHHTGSPEEDPRGGAEERGHRHHRSHRNQRDGNGRLTNGAQEEGKGRGDGNGEKRQRSSRSAKAQSTLSGDECKGNRNGSKSYRWDVWCVQFLSRCRNFWIQDRIYPLKLSFEFGSAPKPKMAAEF